jgi:hypothetical protein
LIHINRHLGFERPVVSATASLGATSNALAIERLPDRHQRWRRYRFDDLNGERRLTGAKE